MQNLTIKHNVFRLLRRLALVLVVLIIGFTSVFSTALATTVLTDGYDAVIDGQSNSSLCNLAFPNNSNPKAIFPDVTIVGHKEPHQVSAGANLPAGKYNLTVATVDSYNDRDEASQPNEQLYLGLKQANGQTVETGLTTDLPDNVKTGLSVDAFNNIDLGSSLTLVTAYHIIYRGINTGPNSVRPICVVFEPIQEPVAPTPELNIACSANPTNVDINQNVNWSVTPTGGDGSYLYSWSGSDGLSGSNRDVSKSYSTSGSKSATVTVTSAGQTKSKTCNVTVNSQNIPGLTGSCVASPNNVGLNTNVNWTANVSGGNNSYNYTWSGTDGLSGTSQSVTKLYSTTGTKNGSVYVTSGDGQSATFNCSTNVSTQSTSLNVSCDVDDSSVDIDEDVQYTANVSGGSGNYIYNWSGTDGLFSTSRSFDWSYDDDGTKRTTITVFSGSESASDTCNVDVDEEDNNDENFDISCEADDDTVAVGERVRFQVDVDGADEDDLDYDWSGDDGFDSSSQSPSMTYNSPGTKEVYVRAESDNDSDSARCYVNVTGNTVLSYNQYNPNNQVLDAVYLSEVPYTGLADNKGLIWFIVGLLLLSAYLAYIFIAYKKNFGPTRHQIHNK